jgi:integrase
MPRGKADERPEVAAVMAQIKALAATVPGLAVTVRQRSGRKPRNPNGMGTVVRLVDQRGRVTFRPRVTVDGLTYWGDGVSVRRGMAEAAAKAEAEQNRKELVRSVERNEYQDVAHRRATLAGVIDDWWRAIEASGREGSTKARKRELLAVLRPHVGTTLPARLAQVRPHHLRDLQQKLREEPVRARKRDGTLAAPRPRGTSTVQRVHDLLVQILRWASKQGMPVYGPILEGAVERPGHDPKEKRSVSVAEALRLIEAMRDERPFGPLVAVMYYQGLRDSEASGLKWIDVGLDGITVQRKRGRRSREAGPPKHDSTGWIPLLPQAKAVLDEHRRWSRANDVPCPDDDWVFLHRAGKSQPWRPPLYDTTWAHIKAAVERTELSDAISAHSLRHGFADAANEAGVSVRDLAEILRNNPAVALRYQHRDVAKLRDAAARISRVMDGK